MNVYKPRLIRRILPMWVIGKLEEGNIRITIGGVRQFRIGRSQSTMSEISFINSKSPNGKLPAGIIKGHFKTVFYRIRLPICRIPPIGSGSQGRHQKATQKQKRQHQKMQGYSAAL